MKLLEKIKLGFSNIATSGSRKRRSIILLSLLVFTNVMAVVAVSLAWFRLDGQQSVIDIVTGDINVEINKITAYKYVYPYYLNSTEYINYSATGTIKSYVLEAIEYKDEEITSTVATIPINSTTSGTCNSTGTNSSATNIYYSNNENFRYYLVGDALFNGVSANPWSISNALAFSSAITATSERPIILDDVIISVGASFTIFDKNTVNEETLACSYYNYGSIQEDSPHFKVENNNRITCLKSGIYRFSFTTNALTISLRQRDDESIIGNNSLDPTKINIDYMGSAARGTQSLNEYIPEAIHAQNTMMILDVELNYKNVNDVVASLNINRLAINSKSIINNGGYSDGEHNVVGYVSAEQTNSLNTSDFYAFYAVFTKIPYANASALWSAMHIRSDSESSPGIYNFDKFPSNSNTSIPCTLHLKENNDSLLIPASSSDNIYHCYIGIEYDYEYSRYFLHKNRIGKTYLLDRDFGFYFVA